MFNTLVCAVWAAGEHCDRVLLVHREGAGHHALLPQATQAEDEAQQGIIMTGYAGSRDREGRSLFFGEMCGSSAETARSLRNPENRRNTSDS